MMLSTILRAFALVALCASVATGQAAVATLTGHVTDQQNAAAPAATVSARHTGTSATWTSATDAEGRFALPMLPPGTYEVTVSLSGFQTWRAQSVVLEVGQDKRIDVQLSVGAVQQDVIVAAMRPVTAAVEGVVAADRIRTLPLNGRNFLELALLIPGNQPTPTFDPTKTSSVLVGSAGQLGRGGNITIDGENNNDDVVGGPLLNLPIDAVQEFQIATNRFGAHLGGSASSVINVVTRSGSNMRSGMASLFARDSAWQASPVTFDGATGAPPFDRQQSSAAAGGPLRRDRLFWFAAAELRTQDGAVLVGSRDTTSRTIRRSFADAPLTDRLWSLRLDATGARNRLMIRYAGQNATEIATSALERAIGSATQRQDASNRYQNLLASLQTVVSPTLMNSLQASVGTFRNTTAPVAQLPQLTFPSLLDGASFRMPQETDQTRVTISEHASLVRGGHTIHVGGALERIDAEFRLGVFRQGRIELVQDFATFDHTGDGRIDDNDLLFAVTLRSGKPDQALNIPDADNVHVAGFVQDDWNVSSRLHLNVGLRYEFDTDVNNQSRVGELNPIVLPFVNGERRRDTNNLSPRMGFAWTPTAHDITIRGGYGIYYDRIVLQITSLERGLDGRALPIEVRAGNVSFLDPATGRLPPFAPTVSNPFTGFVLPGAGASGINIIDPRLQHPTVHQLHLGVEASVLGTRARIDGVHNQGTHFLIGRTLGEVFNPVVGGPDRVVNIESSARTKYDAMLVSVERRVADAGYFTLAYTLAKASNYANDDQIPFLNGPIDPSDLRREFGPTPHDRRHRLVASGQVRAPGGVDVAALWTLSSGVPMDIMMPDGQSRVPMLARNAGGRQFSTPSELNTFITGVNASGGVNGTLLPLVSDDARFSDSFNSLDLRVSRPYAWGSQIRVEPMLELFNVFNVVNVLGTSNVNYSGFANVLVRDSENSAEPGYLRSSTFGQPVTTAGGVFGSGGPRAMQLGVRVSF